MRINRFLWGRCITALVLLALPAVVQAQFIFVTNNGAITITGYNGAGGAVVVPNVINGHAVTGIGEYAFADDANLISITITNSVTSIGADAFNGCTNLANVDLTNDLTSIGEGAFYDCSSMTNFTVPTSVTNIGVEAFVGCACLTNFSVPAGNPTYVGIIPGVLFDKVHETIVAYPEGQTNSFYSIPFGVGGIGPYAFASCFHLASVIMTNTYFGGVGWLGTTNIGEGAFAFCTGLTNVVIAGTVTNVGGFAFAFCTNLTSANFLDNAPVDVGTAFYGDPMAVVYYPPGTTGWGPTFGDAPTAVKTTPASVFAYITNDGSIAITGCGYPINTSQIISPMDAIAIPSIINGYPVTRIGEIGGNSTITSVTIPDSVTNIEQEAFFNCFSMSSIIIPDSVTSIGDLAFQGCSSLVSVAIPDSVTSIGDQIFGGCSSLTSVIIGGGITSIGYDMFDDCINLSYVGIPNSVTNIEQDAFFNCTSLTSIVIPNGVTSIGDFAFDACGNLASVTIPTSVTSIGQDAFRNCTRLTDVDIPNNVSSIGAQAFYADGLTSITIPGSLTNLGTGAFQNCTNVTAAYFQGNAPIDSGNAFSGDPAAVVYYLPGTTGWGATFGGAPTELWNPQATSFVTAGNQFGFNITGPTNLAIVVEACTNLANPVWIPVSTNMLSGSGLASFSDSQRLNYPNRYYRFSAP